MFPLLSFKYLEEYTYYSEPGSFHVTCLEEYSISICWEGCFILFPRLHGFISMGRYLGYIKCFASDVVMQPISLNFCLHCPGLLMGPLAFHINPLQFSNPPHSCLNNLAPQQSQFCHTSAALTLQVFPSLTEYIRIYQLAKSSMGSHLPV